MKKYLSILGLNLLMGLSYAQVQPPVNPLANVAVVDASSSPTLSRIKKSGFVVMSVRDTSSPFSYNNGSDQFIGYSVELCENVIKGIMADLGMPNLKVVYLPVSGGERIPFVANGTSDMECSSTTITKARQEQADFSYATFYSQTMFAGNKNKKLSKLEDLKKTTVAVGEGTIQLKYLNELNEKQRFDIKVVTYKNATEAYLAAMDGKADFAISDDLLLLGIKNSIKDEQNSMVMFDLALLPNTYAMILPKGDQMYINTFNKHLKVLFDTKKAEEIYNKWFLSPVPPQNKPINWPIGKTKDLFENPSSEALLP